MSVYAGKKILVTGGAGSIGSEVVRQLIKHNPKEIRIFGRGEERLAALRKELKDNANVIFFVGDIRDESRLEEAMAGADIVFHAAAMKHVDICEYNPREAIKTNVLGTDNVITYALKNNVERAILISTDKATEPTNTMGATKMLAERLMAEADAFRAKGKRTIFCATRFGNVLGSAGSILPLFEKSIKEKKEIPVTDEEMTRFVMTIPEAAGLVLEAGRIAKGGETFVLKMKSLRLRDLISVIIDIVCRKYGYKTSDIKKNIIGLRPGEKIHEGLISETECPRTLETDSFYIIISPLNPKKADYSGIGAKKAEVTAYNSNGIKLLTRDEIRHLIEKEGLL